MAHQRHAPEPIKRVLPAPIPQVRRDGRKVYFTDCSGVCWRVVLAYRAPRNWALSTKVRTPEWAGRLFIRKADRAMRFYEVREWASVYAHDHRDLTAATLQAQLALASNVDVVHELRDHEVAKRPSCLPPIDGHDGSG